MDFYPLWVRFRTRGLDLNLDVFILVASGERSNVFYLHPQAFVCLVFPNLFLLGEVLFLFSSTIFHLVCTDGLFFAWRETIVWTVVPVFPGFTCSLSLLVLKRFVSSFLCKYSCFCRTAWDWKASKIWHKNQDEGEQRFGTQQFSRTGGTVLENQRWRWGSQPFRTELCLKCPLCSRCWCTFSSFVYFWFIDGLFQRLLMDLQETSERWDFWWTSQNPSTTFPVTDWLPVASFQIFSMVLMHCSSWLSPTMHSG